jgi:hypothetical protein
MAVPGEQESFRSQSFSRPTPKRTTTSGVSDSRNRLAQERKETRQKYFPDRKGVSPLRLDKRKTQADLVTQFKKDFLKPIEGVTQGGEGFGRYTRKLEAGPNVGLETYRQQVANKYGPTFREIGSDVRYGLGNIAQGFGDLAVSAMSGDTGLIGAVKTVGNFFLDQANKGYDDLNDVQKQIFDKQTNYKFAAQAPEIQAVERAKNSAIEAQNDALGLSALAASGADATDTSAVGGGGLSSFVNEPIGTFGGGTMGPRVAVRDIQKEQLDAMDIGYVESGQFKEGLQKSGILTVDDPSTQEPLPDSTKIPGYSATIGTLKKRLKAQGLDDLQIQSAVNQVTQQILSGDFTGDYEVDTGSTMDDQVSFTPFDNPFNLEFRGQEGAEPGYGPSDDPGRFASFDTLDQGLTAGIDRVAEIVGEGKSTDEFLDVYAPRSDNPKSYDNYLATLKDKVGETIEPNEIKPLTEGIVRFENKPELADQYLNYLEQEKNKLYSGILS